MGRNRNQTHGASQLANPIPNAINLVFGGASVNFDQSPFLVHVSNLKSLRMIHHSSSVKFFVNVITQVFFLSLLSGKLGREFFVTKEEELELE